MDAWLTPRAEKLAAVSGTAEARLDPTQYDIDAIVELDRIATDSGDPRNAPVLCYLLGFAAGNSGMDLHALIAALQ